MDAAEQDFLDAIDGAVIAADHHGDMTYFSREAEELLGWPADEVVGGPLTRIMPERMRDVHLRGFQRYVATGESRLASRVVRVPALRPDGSEREVDLSIHLLRRPGGTDLIVATLAAPQDAGEATSIGRIVAESMRRGG